jgi:hypothetical protein
VHMMRSAQINCQRRYRMAAFDERHRLGRPAPDADR